MQWTWPDTYDTWLNVPSTLQKTFLGWKIARYFRSLKWKWERLVSGMEHTHPANKDCGRLRWEDFLIAALGALPTTVSCVLVMCC
jgi:hypothetical protein